MEEVTESYAKTYAIMNGRKGFTMTPDEHMEEIRRRYDVDDNQVISQEEAKEWAFCFGPFLDEYDIDRMESPVSLAETLCGWEPEPEPELEPEPEPEPKPEPKPNPNPKLKPDPKPELESEPEPEREYESDGLVETVVSSDTG